MPDKEQTPIPSRWVTLLRRDLPLVLAALFYFDSKTVRKEKDEAVEKYNQHLQQDANAQAGIVVRLLERGYVPNSSTAGTGSTWNIELDTTKKATQNRE